MKKRLEFRYGEGMTGQLVDSPQELESTIRKVDALLREGMPIDLTARIARVYAERCEALRAELGERHPFTRLQIICAEVVASAQTSLDQGVSLAAEAQRIAAELGDEAARAYALVAWGFSHPAPEHTDERVRAGHQILETARTFQDAALESSGSVLLLVGLLEQGEIRSLDARLLDLHGAGSATVTAHADPSSWFSCLRSILDGNTEQAERQAEEIFAKATRNGTDALALYTAQIGMIRWMQGRVDCAEEGFLSARREYPEQLLWSASLGWLWLLQGRRSAGEALLDSLPTLEQIPRDRYWLSTITVLAEAARLRNNQSYATELRGMLLPFADRLVTVGIGVAFWGTAARTLGLLEEHLGLFEDARTHLELAVTMSKRIGAMAWHAEALIELAEFALRHDLTDVLAFELLAEARATSEARGFPALARRAMHQPRIRVLGGFEVVSLCGVRAEWSSRKARELLKMLVAARGVSTSREVFMDALWPGVPPSQLANRFSVAVNAIRRALDPNRLLPTQQHVVTEGESIHLDVDTVSVDLERFLGLAAQSTPRSTAAALQLYRGEAFSDEPYSDWAATARHHASRVRASLA